MSIDAFARDLKEFDSLYKANALAKEERKILALLEDAKWDNQNVIIVDELSRKLMQKLQKNFHVKKEDVGYMRSHSWSESMVVLSSHRVTNRCSAAKANGALESNIGLRSASKSKKSSRGLFYLGIVVAHPLCSK